jgi:hypothetical protein
MMLRPAMISAYAANRKPVSRRGSPLDLLRMWIRVIRKRLIVERADSTP